MSETKTKGVADFIFLIDGTGSMQPCLDAIKGGIKTFFAELTGSQSVIRDWRGKFITYRDEQADGDDWYHDNPFVHNDPAALTAQLEQIDAHGGGDEPESLLDALHKVATMEQTDRGAQELDPSKWRYRSDAARVVIIFTDATFKSPMTYSGGAGGTAC